MRDALAAPIPEYRPDVPPGCRINLDGEPLNICNLTTHRVAWRQSNSEGRFWPEGWTAWLMQFLPHMSAQDHREWMSVLRSQPNVPAIKWQTSVVLRILNGDTFKGQDGGGVKFGGESRDGIGWGNDTSDIQWGSDK